MRHSHALALVLVCALTLNANAGPSDGAHVVAPPFFDLSSDKVDASFGFHLMSDYNFRGISQASRNPSFFAYGELTYDWAYAGAAYYATDLPSDPIGEVDLYFGVRRSFAGVDFDVGALYYHYPRELQLFDGGAVTPTDSDYWELAAKATYDVTAAFNVGANLFYAYDYAGTGADATYLAGTAKYNMLPDLAVSGEFGHYWLGDTTDPAPAALVDYNYWNVGFTYSLSDTVTTDLRYHGTDLSRDECFTNTTDPHGLTTGTTPGQSTWCGSSLVATLAVDLMWSGLKK